MQQPQNSPQMQNILQMQQQAGTNRFINTSLNLRPGMITLPSQQPQLALANNLPLMRSNPNQNSPSHNSGGGPNYRMPQNQQSNGIMGGVNQFGSMMQNMSPQSQQGGSMRGQAGITQCRVCRAPNAPGVAFCRNCRAPTR